MRFIEGSIIKIDADGNEVMSSYIDTEAGELLRRERDDQRIEDSRRPPGPALAVVQNVTAEAAGDGVGIIVRWDPVDLTNAARIVIRSVPAGWEYGIRADGYSTAVVMDTTDPNQPYSFVVYLKDDQDRLGPPSALSNAVSANG